MNLHEYQGKEILNSYGVGIQRGIVASTPEAAVDAQRRAVQPHRSPQPGGHYCPPRPRSSFPRTPPWC